MEKLLESGIIATTHGIRGEVKINPWCDSPSFLCEFDTLYLKDGTALEVERARVHKNGVIVKLRGVDTMDDALLLLNKVIYIDKDSVELEEGVYFIEDLLGLEVVDVDSGALYGKITDVITNTANDVYAVTDEQGKTYYIPGIAEIVKEVDIDKNKMFIKPIEGLIE